MLKGDGPPGCGRAWIRHGLRGLELLSQKAQSDIPRGVSQLYKVWLSPGAYDVSFWQRPSIKINTFQAGIGPQWLYFKPKAKQSSPILYFILCYMKRINRGLPPRQAPMAKAKMRGFTGRFTSASWLRLMRTGICEYKDELLKMYTDFSLLQFSLVSNQTHTVWWVLHATYSRWWARSDASMMTVCTRPCCFSILWRLLDYLLREFTQISASPLNKWNIKAFMCSVVENVSICSWCEYPSHKPCC